MPAQVNQLSAGGQYPHEDCGEACVASILIDAGHADTVRDIEQFDAEHGDSPSDGTGGDVHVERLQAAGLGAHVMTGPTRANIIDGLAKGHDRWLVAIWSDHYGEPSPGSGIGHWILVYGYDPSSDTFYAMNPIGGRLVTYTGAQIESADQQYGVAVETFVGPPKPVNSGEVHQHVSLNKPVVAAVAVPGGAVGDVWVVSGDGGVFTRGHAPFFGSAANDNAGEVVAAAAHPSGKGYWLVDTVGAVYAFGAAGYHGGANTEHLNQPVAAVVPSPSGNGYTLIAGDGGTFNYGDSVVETLV